MERAPRGERAVEERPEFRFAREMHDAAKIGGVSDVGGQGAGC